MNRIPDLPAATVLPLLPDEWIGNEPARDLNLAVYRVHDDTPTGGWVWIHGHEQWCHCERVDAPCLIVRVSVDAIQRIVGGTR